MKKTRRPKSFPISLSNLFRSPTLRQLVIILLSISLIPALVIFFSMYSISSQLIQQEVQTHTRNTLVDARDSVNEILRQTEDVAFGLAIDSNVNALLTEDDLAIGSNRRASLRTLLESTLKTNRSVLNMLFLETPENTVYTFTLAPKLSLHDICIIDSGYEQQVLQKGGAVYWFDLSNGVTGSPPDGGRVHPLCLRHLRRQRKGLSGNSEPVRQDIRPERLSGRTEQPGSAADHPPSGSAQPDHRLQPDRQ